MGIQSGNGAVIWFKQAWQIAFCRIRVLRLKLGGPPASVAMCWPASAWLAGCTACLQA